MRDDANSCYDAQFPHTPPPWFLGAAPILGATLVFTLVSGLLFVAPKERPDDELLHTQRMTGTNEFARGWNAALDNLRHHRKAVEK